MCVETTEAAGLVILEQMYKVISDTIIRKVFTERMTFMQPNDKIEEQIM